MIQQAAKGSPMRRNATVDEVVYNSRQWFSYSNTDREFIGWQGGEFLGERYGELCYWTNHIW